MGNSLPGPDTGGVAPDNSVQPASTGTIADGGTKADRGAIANSRAKADRGTVTDSRATTQSCRRTDKNRRPAPVDGSVC